MDRFWLRSKGSADLDTALESITRLAIASQSSIAREHRPAHRVSQYRTRNCAAMMSPPLENVPFNVLPDCVRSIETLFV